MMIDIKPDSKDLKILYLSNAPFLGSGYGVQCNGNCYAWNKHYDVRVLANYGIQGAMLGVNGLQIYPTLVGDDHGNRTSELIFSQGGWKPDIFVTLYDIWMGAYIRGSPQRMEAIHPHWIPIIMVDHEPCPESTLISAEPAYRRVVPTMWAKNELKRHGLDSEFIPFGINNDIWTPVKSEDERREGKKWVDERSIPFNLNDRLPITEDSFLIHMNGANKDAYRKAFPRMFTALQIFLEQNPDAKSDTRVYVHSWMKMARDIPHGAKVLHVDRYCKGTADYHNLCSVPEVAMARIARSADVFLHLSEGGGFEIPLLEAMASGVPPIALKFVANGELVGEGKDTRGWLIPVIKAESGAEGRYFTSLDSTQGIADEYKTADALAEAYNSEAKRKRLGRRGVSFAKDYSWDKVNGKWFELFEGIRDEWAYKPLDERLI